MRQFFLTLSFDGTRYAGFQIQKNAETVQATLERTLFKILKEKIKVLPAGRTDAGVHALAHVISFKANVTIPAAALKRALNGLLPSDIVITQARVVPLSFHPRYEAMSKWYRYTIRNDALRSPFDRLYTTFYPHPLDLRAMREAAKNLTGRRDFKSFQASDKVKRTSVRKIDRLSIRNISPYVVIDIEGNGFLYKMVRNIVGTLLDVGRGRTSPEAFRKIVSKKERRLAGPTAPPEGLCLMKVRY